MVEPTAQSAAYATLARFAKHTKQDQTSPSVLAQKWLALHVQSAPAALVYTRIASDYALVNLRTHEPSLSEAYSSGAPEPATFVYIMKHGYPRRTPIAAHEFGEFRDVHFPRTIGQEAWVDYQRDTHWKERAYYMAVQCGIPRELIEAIHHEDVVAPNAGATREDRDAVSDMYARLVRHAKLHPSQAYGTDAEVGALIGQIKLPIGGEVVLQEEESLLGVGDHGPPSKDMDELEAAAVEAPVDGALMYAAVDEDFIQQPVDCSAYRRSAFLPPAFPTDKLMKQMILARLGVPAPSEVLGRSQTALGARSAVDDANWEALKANVRATAIEETPAVRDLHAMLYQKELQRPGTPQDFVRTAMELYGGGHDDAQGSTKRYLQKYPQPDAAIIKAALVM